MISGTKRARHGASRDTCCDDVVGCRRGRGQPAGKQEEATPPQRRKLRGRAAEAARRRSVRLLRLVYVAGVAGIGLVVLQVTSSSPAKAYWKAKASPTEGGVVDFGNSQDKARRSSPAAVRDSGGRRLVTSSDGGEEQGVLEELTEEEEEAAATAETCADNSFSGGGAGKVVLLVIAILFTFNGLAIVCDEFFQASLERISDVSSR